MAGEWGQEVLLLSHLYGRKQITKVRADKQLRDLLTSTPSGENKSQNETAASQPHSLVVLIIFLLLLAIPGRTEQACRHGYRNLFNLLLAKA